MNPLLTKLQPYPFERLKQLFLSVTPNPAFNPISLGIGEPKHATPEFIKTALSGALDGLAIYPATAGTPQLRTAFATWMERRYGLNVDANTQVLPVNGSREALFAFTQVVMDPTKTTVRNGVTQLPIVVCPNPFYQIYEGAALLAGAEPYYVNSDPAHNFGVDWDSVPDDIWERTQMIFVCSPGNPAGAVMPLEAWKKLFALSDRYGFVIASDECYSEIYFQDGANGEFKPPLGGLEAAYKLGNTDFKNIVSFTSLSKRSNVPGMRSGFCAGDAAILKQFALFRTYHGSAMSLVVQAASTAAWSDEGHVVANRALYRDKFMQVTPLLSEVLEVALPDAGFYLWAKIPAKHNLDDAAFARALLAQYNVTVLPGSYLAREASGVNPGANYIRMALVATTAECVEAAQRIVQFVKSL